VDGDWLDRLSDDERDEWDRFVAWQHEHTVKAMAASAMVMTIVPRGDSDVKFAVELGFAIMMGKPIIALALPGVTVPYGLRKVADAIIVADLDTEAGRELADRQMRAAVARVKERDARASHATSYIEVRRPQQNQQRRRRRRR
jgi:hypothetical protein